MRGAALLAELPGGSRIWNAVDSYNRNLERNESGSSPVIAAPAVLNLTDYPALRSNAIYTPLAATGIDTLHPQR